MQVNVAVLCLLLITSTGCEQNDILGCFKGQILAITCGGTVIQFLDTPKVGEDWINNFSDSSAKKYSNCVLVGNLTSPEIQEGDVLYFKYQKVEFFTSGSFCKIGGLPRVKIEITELLTDMCQGH